MSPLSNATTLANYASGIGTQGATLEIDSNNKRVGIGTTNPQGPEGSLQVGTAVTISGNSGIVSATTFHGDFGSSTSVAGNLTVSGVITYEDVTNIDSIGIMTARSDLSIADKIIHTGDTNTAIRFPAADTVTAETSGSERVRITSDGKIGINQSTPQTTFHSTGTTNGQQATFGIDDSGLKISTFQKTDNDAGVILDAQKSSNGTLTFATTGTERMRIDSSGRMGLGTNSPSALLHVSAAYNVIGLKVFGGSAGYSSPLIVGNAGGTEYLRVDDGGRLLVNTTTSRIVEDHVGNGPQAKIQIEGTNSDAIMSIISAGTADANRCGTISLGRHRNSTIGGTPTIVQNGDALGAIVFAAGDGTDMRTSGAKIHAIVDGTPGSNDMPGALIFSTTTDGSSNPYNQERMRITSAGDIGLGVTPVAGSRLHVKGAADCYVSLQAGSSSGNDAILFRRSTGEQKGAILYDTDDNYFLINVNDGERLRIDSSGQVGIGAIPSRKLTVGGDINVASGSNIESTSSGGTLRVQGGSTYPGGNILLGGGQGTDDIRFRTTGASTSQSERMRIDSSGRLLVATTAARTKYFNTTAYGPLVNFEGNNNSSRIVSFIHNDSSGGPMLILGASGGSTAGNNDLVNSSTTYGFFSFQGTDGTDLVEAARISAEADGTPAANDMPGALMFYTTADGAATTTERMRIDSSGNIGIGENSPSNPLVVKQSTGNINLELHSTSSGRGTQIMSHNDHATFYHGLAGDTSGDYIYYTANAKNHIFSTNNAERMRIDSAGSLLVGTTSASSFPDRLITAGDHNRQSSYLDIRSSLVGALLFADGTSGNAAYRGQVEYNHSDDSMRLWTAATEKMRIRSDGAVLFNRTSESFLGSSFVQVGIENTNGSYFPLGIRGNTNAIVFNQSTNNSSAVGSITMTASATNFNTSSDYRLKENVVAIADGITRVKQLQPKRFNFIVDSDTTVDGFIAHEAQTVVPEAVTGTKDQVDKDGEAVMQDMDQSKLVPLLTAALQEAIAKIETLETKVAALEG